VQVLRAVSPVVDASKLVVSIAAGVTSGHIAEVGVNAWLDPFDDKGL
jgi:pyrroline-5-carboxylate reductase